jgi:hypothetical protein
LRVNRDQPLMIRGTPRLVDEHLQAAIAALRAQDTDAARDAVLYLGQRHQAFPALVIQDPVLAPVDKILWMVIWQRGAAGGTRALFPTYAELSSAAHIRSETTIARALAILRATRWLSLCARVRDKAGKFRGHIYAIHDEPLPLADAQHLDPDYLEFLTAATDHPHPRVRLVARAVLDALDEDISADRDVTAPPHPIARRLEALRALTAPEVYRYFSFTPAILRRLANTTAADRVDRLQILETANPLQDLESGSSSININKTTTTPARTRAQADTSALQFPAALTPNQRALAARYLERVPASEHQAVLDELEGRLRAARQGARPLYDPLRYLHRLCVEVTRGRFVRNLGSAVESERQRRRLSEQSASHTATPTASASTPATTPEKNPRENPVAAIRQRFNLPSGRPSST